MASRSFNVLLFYVLIASIAAAPITCQAFSPRQILQPVGNLIKKAQTKTWVTDIAKMVAAGAILTIAEMAFAKGKSIIFSEATRSKALQNNEAQYCTDDEGLIAPETVPQEIQNDIINVLKHPEQLIKHNVPFYRGILLTGPNGTGKSQLARYIAKETGCKVIYETASGLIGQAQGSGARSIHELIQKAKKISWIDRISNIFKRVGSCITRRDRAPKKPVFIILDEVDSIALPRDEKDATQPEYYQPTKLLDKAREAERVATLNQLLCEADGANSSSVIPEVLFIYCSNKPASALSKAFIRPGRVNIFEIPALTASARQHVVELHAKRLKNCPLAKELSDNDGKGLLELMRSPIAQNTSGDVLSKALRNAGIKVAGQPDAQITRTSFEAELEEIIDSRQSKLQLLTTHITSKGYQFGLGITQEEERKRLSQALDAYTNKDICLALDRVANDQPEALKPIIDQVALMQKLQELLTEREAA